MMTYIADAWNSLIHAWWLKTIMSAISGIAIWLIGLKHIQVLGVFILLVFVDLLTKWAAISYKMLIDMGAKPENLSPLTKWQAIPVAFGKGLISSNQMRKPFVKKTLTYVFATLAAVCFDLMAGGIGGQSNFAVNLVWLYLGSAEFISILENMRDGGNDSMGRFLDLAKTKIERKVKL